MANVKLVKSIYTGSDVTALGEVASADTIDQDLDITGTVTANRGVVEARCS